MKTVLTLASGALLLAAGSAFAQDAPAPAPTEASPPAQTLDLPPAEEAGAEFTDSQIEGFAAAVLDIRALNADETLDEAAVRAQAETIVAEHGLDAETYNEIGTAAQSDPAVARRIQVAIAAMQESGDS